MSSHLSGNCGNNLWLPGAQQPSDFKPKRSAEGVGGSSSTSKECKSTHPTSLPTLKLTGGQYLGKTAGIHAAPAVSAQWLYFSLPGPSVSTIYLSKTSRRPWKGPVHLVWGNLQEQETGEQRPRARIWEETELNTMVATNRGFRLSLLKVNLCLHCLVNSP